MIVLLDELRIPADKATPSIDRELLEPIARALCVPPEDILSWTILRRGTDARKKPDIRLLYRIRVTLRDGVRPKNASCEDCPRRPWTPPEKHGFASPLVVGAGPGGLFAAYLYALAGYRPVVVDRGFDIVRRKADIDHFFETRDLNPESNLLYGEGGAGTWSDGKLFTRIRDPRIDFILKTFIECGAQEEIRYFSHPHIGSDRLPDVIANLRKRILALGGSFLWGKCVSSLFLRDGKCEGVRLSDGEILLASPVLIASGHSARDLIQTMVSQGAAYTMKGFQVGVRIEHPQFLINKVQYGVADSYPCLGAAEYSVSDAPSDANPGGMASFCMCPGGEVIPATPELRHLRTNGMSRSLRDGPFANSALVTGFPADSFDCPLHAFEFLGDIEKNVFLAGGMDFTFPAQSAEDFLSGELHASERRQSSCRLGTAPAKLDSILPRRLVRSLRSVLPKFERRIPGFIRTGLLIGAETSVSSPVRFLRDPETLQSSIPGLWIAGEGAGMAGGITSAAVDGMRAAEQSLKR